MSDFKTSIPLEELGKSPRYYQIEAAKKTAEYLEKGFTRVLVKSPTGSGKTFTIKMISISEDFREKCGVKDGEKLKVLYIAGKNRLLRQAIEEFNDVSDQVEIIPQSAFSKIPEEVIKRGWDATFFDECHHEPMGSIQKILGGLIHKPIIGLTADDERGDGLLLKFDTVVTAISNEEAASKGFIEKTGVNTIIDTGTKDKTEITCQIVENYHKSMGNSIIFLRTQDEVVKVHKHLKKLGLDVEYLRTNCPESELDEALDKLANGEIQFLINCQKIGEGVDTPNVTDVLLMRTFHSAAEKRQYIGRSTRPDSPSAAWELIDPFVDSHTVKELVGATKYERIISYHEEKWSHELISGDDPTWGKMSEYRNAFNLKAFTQSGMEAGVSPIKDSDVVEVSLSEANNQDTNSESSKKSKAKVSNAAPQMGLF